MMAVGKRASISPTKEDLRRCCESKRLKTAPTNPNWTLRTLNSDFDRRHTNDEIHSSIDLSPVLSAIIDTPPMQRLRGLKQLSTAEYVYVNVNHNRFEHSLGVAHLAGKMCSTIMQRQPRLGCTEKDVLCVQLAGLLHDIGHGPFSHSYEEFLAVLEQQHLVDHPELRSAYEAALPPIPKHWHHEIVSLQLIDTALEHLGLAIDLNRLDEPLQQIGSGVDALSMKVFGHGSRDDDVMILTSRDLVFVKECIWGKPIPELEARFGPGFHGRDASKEWLYDIVSNRHSGLDVDKVDYYARDERRAKKGAGEIETRMIEEAVVAKAKCTHPKSCYRCRGGPPSMHLMICYPEKMVKTSMDFFRKRFELHTKVYRHKTTVAAAYMICDILCWADPYMRLPIRNLCDEVPKQSTLGYTSVPLSRAMLHPESYLRLRDSIIDQIANSEDERLRPAQRLIHRLWSRDLYKCAASQCIDLQDANEKQMWRLSEQDIKKDMLDIAQQGHHEDGLLLERGDFLVERCEIHHGSREHNPLSRMRFLEKTKLPLLRESPEGLPEACPIDESKYLAQLPRCFTECSIRVYSRTAAKTDLVRHVFYQWVSESRDEMKLTPFDNDNVKMGVARPAMLSQESVYDYDEDNDEEEEGYASQDDRYAMSAITPPRAARKY